MSGVFLQGTQFAGPQQSFDGRYSERRALQMTKGREIDSMRHIAFAAAAVALAALLLAGCGQGGEAVPGAAGSGEAAPGQTTQAADPPAADDSPLDLTGQEAAGHQADGISRENALSVALENAGVPEEDAYNIKNEMDEDNGIPIYEIEFETEYGDYDFSIAREDGRIVGADYEVDEEWLSVLGGSAVTLEEAVTVVQGKVPGVSAEEIQIWEEHGDGRGRYEGELFYGGMEYEFEIDPQTGMIFDWNADLRD